MAAEKYNLSQKSVYFLIFRIPLSKRDFNVFGMWNPEKFDIKRL